MHGLHLPGTKECPEQCFYLSGPVHVVENDESLHKDALGEQLAEIAWPRSPFGQVVAVDQSTQRDVSACPGLGRGTVPAHLFAYQLEYGGISRLVWSGTDDAVLCHQCDFADCTNPAHMQLGTNRSNRTEYERRRRNIPSPLADVRGPAGRTRTAAAAIRIASRNSTSTGSKNSSVRPRLQDVRSHSGSDPATRY
ncbi:hypothetical protein ABH922_005777 [Rhodococcus sp. 27YEA15]|uniref:hypothetical protein n=1 Tax=Rhodococcus sp. 27YEA15 TaxID=3156259 RepID=UPI003C7B0614